MKQTKKLKQNKIGKNKSKTAKNKTKTRQNKTKNGAKQNLGRIWQSKTKYDITSHAKGPRHTSSPWKETNVI